MRKVCTSEQRETDSFNRSENNPNVLKTVITDTNLGFSLKIVKLSRIHHYKGNLTHTHR